MTIGFMSTPFMFTSNAAALSRIEEQRQTRKVTLEDLAFFGGLAAFDEPLYVGRPNIGNRRRLLQRIEGILERRWLTNNGLCVQEFERRLAEVLGVRHCIVVCNATSG